MNNLGRPRVRPVGVIKSLAQVEEEHMLSVVNMCDGNMAAAADVLEIDRRTLYRRLAETRVKR